MKSVNILSFTNSQFFRFNPIQIELGHISEENRLDRTQSTPEDLLVPAPGHKASDSLEEIHKKQAEAQCLSRRSYHPILIPKPNPNPFWILVSLFLYFMFYFDLFILSFLPVILNSFENEAFHCFMIYDGGNGNACR